MILPLDPRADLIIVPTRVIGLSGEYILRFVIDTGATSSVLAWDHALQLGYDPAQAPISTQTTTASGKQVVPWIRLSRIESLGHVLYNFPVLCQDIPTDLAVDGLLGLDFLRGKRLTLDFRLGLLTLD